MSNTNRVSTSGVLFSLEDVRSPRAYCNATFLNPSDIHIIRAEGKAIYFRLLTDVEVEDTVSMKEIASSIVTGDSNIIWEMCVQYKSEVPSFAPSF